MEVQAVNQNQQVAKEQGVTPPGKGITRDDFLKLLITQLQNQDPLKPLDNQEFAMQLATFNSLDQLISINKGLGALQSDQLLWSRIGSTSLIGKEVIASGNQVSLKAGTATPVRYVLGADAARVVINITDSAGNLVRALEMGSQPAGEKAAAWDGKDGTGKTLTDGVYSFEVNAFDGSGKKVVVTHRVQAVVTGVDLAGSEPLLEVGGIKVPLSAVIGIR